MRDGAPIRFLVLLLAGWTLLRVATVAPSWWSEEQAAAPLPAPVAASDDPASMVATVSRREDRVRPSNIAPLLSPIGAERSSFRSVAAFPIAARENVGFTDPVTRSHAPPATPPIMRSLAPVTHSAPSPPTLVFAQTPFTPSPIAAPRPPSRRWSGSAWLLARRDGGAALAPGGTLGASQAGARLLYRINDDARRPLGLSGRLYVPLRRIAGAEVAAGFDWQPSARLPLHLLLERRQGVGREGRNAFAATVYGGGSADLGRGWRLDGYAQAGIVGTRSRDAFLDGSARLTRAFGPVEVGGGVWGAAQPGASRLDVGPQLSVPIRARSVSLRLSAEYRVRVAGDARPASGPALTLGVDF